MFLFHWCMNALRCRRDMTLETMPLSPTKYNGLPQALDCGLQRQLVDDIAASGYDVNGISRSLMDEEDTVDSPRFFQDRLITVRPLVVDDPHTSATSLSCCHSKSRDSVIVTAGGCFHPDDLDEPVTSRLSSILSTDDVTADEINGHCGCECEPATAADENTGQQVCSSDVSSKPVPLFPDFCMYSLKFPKPHLYSEVQHGVQSLPKDSSIVTNNDLPRITQDAKNIGFFTSNSSSSTDVNALDTSHRNAVASFRVDTFQDPLVTVAVLLVNSAVNSAVRILDGDAALASERNPVNEIGLLPISNTSTSIPPLPSSDESTKDLENPVDVAASRLVNQVLSEVVRNNRSSVVACTETLPGETSISAGVCAARPHCSSSPRSPRGSDSMFAADDDVESCATANAGGVLTPAAGDDYLSESSTTGCSSVDESEVLVAHEPFSNCNFNTVYGLCDDFESMASLSSGRLTFVSESWRPVSPPFTDAFSPDDVSEALNNNNVVVGLFDDVDVNDHQCVSGDLRPYDYLRHVDINLIYSDTTAERSVDLSGDSDADDATKSSFEHGMSDDDNCLDICPTLDQYTSENIVAETWNSCESSCRPEDYFFRQYVIPVDHLDANKATSTTSNDVISAQSDRDEQRNKMQLDLKAADQSNDTDLDADIEAVAAFCRAVFTPVETDTDYSDDKISPFDIVSNPETPDVDEWCTRDGRPTVVRRCISLRTSPGTPHKKKSVRFADALGLDLEYVRQIQTVDEPLATITGDDVGGRNRRPLLAEASAAWHRSQPLVRRRYLCACFQAPGMHPDFMERVRRSRVVLEKCEADDRASTITGVIRVANVAYHKVVAARVTTDGWATQTDVTADYVPRSNDGTTDRFSFQIVLPHGAANLGRRVEFAVYFTAFFNCDNRSETYWDNNFGANYCFECYAHGDGETVTSDTEMDDDGDQFSAWMSFV